MILRYSIIVIDEEPLCCMCGTSKFVGIVNTGKKYYCNACMRKINDSGMDYWKPCSMEEGFANFLSTRKKQYSVKEQLRQIKEKDGRNKKE